MRKSPLGIEGTNITFTHPGPDGRKTSALVKARDENGKYQGHRVRVTSWHRDGTPIIPQAAIDWAKATRKDFIRGAATASRASLKLMMEALAEGMEAEPCTPDRVALVRVLATKLVEAGLDDLKAATFPVRVRKWLGEANTNWAHPADAPWRHKDRKLAAATKNKLLGIIRRAVQLAVTRRLLPFDPMVEVKAFKDETETLKALFTVPELARLVSDQARDHALTERAQLTASIEQRQQVLGSRVAAIKAVAEERGCHWTSIYNALGRPVEHDPWWLACCMLVYTGARAQEAMHLRWENVRWDTKYIALKEHPDFELKTDQERLIPMEPELCEILLPRMRPHGWIIEDDRIRRGGLGSTSERGRVLRDYQHYFAAYCDRIGMDIGDRTVHSLRHCFITMKIARADMNLDRLRKGVGHADIKTTQGYSDDSQEYEAIVDAWPDASLHLRRPLPASAILKTGTGEG